MQNRNFLVVMSAFLLASCSEPGFDPAPKGAELLAPFKANLKDALVSGMQDGPVNAISACRTEAPHISTELSVDGVVMGRSSHKLRNQGNVAPSWAKPIIDGYVVDSTQRTPAAVELGDGRYGYVEPIMMQPLCVTCHGSDVHPDVAAKISELYPDDEATGFSEGDFRGVFWVEFPAGP